MKANDLNEGLGSAMLSKGWQKLTGNPAGSMSIKDKMVQQQFIKDLVGRAGTNLAQGIQNGIIDPSSGIGPVNPGVNPVQQANLGSQAGGDMAGANGSGVMGSRQAKQFNINDVYTTLQALNPKQLNAVSKILAKRAGIVNEEELDEVNWKGLASGASNIAQKGLAGAKQAYKFAKPYVKKLGQGIKAAPGAIATAGGATAGAIAGMPSRAKTAYRGGKQFTAGATLTIPELQQALFTLTPEQAKELYNYVTQLQAARRSGLKESALNEQQYKYTISSYLQTFLKQYMPNVDTTALKSMCDAVQQTYSKDKGRQALQKMAGAAYSLYWTAGQDSPDTDDQGLGTANQGTAATTQNPNATQRYPGGQLAQAKEVISKLGPNNKVTIYNQLKKEVDAIKQQQAANKAAKRATKKSATAPVQPPTQPVAESKSYKVWGQK